LSALPTANLRFPPRKQEEKSSCSCKRIKNVPIQRINVWDSQDYCEQQTNTAMKETSYAGENDTESAILDSEHNTRTRGLEAPYKNE
jgi:hypothetical protein